MTTQRMIGIDETLADELQEIAEQENRSLDEILMRLLAFYKREQSPTPPEIPDYPPRPAWSLTDDDIEVPDDIEDKEAYRAAARSIAPKLYEKARAYWRKIGDQERLALTDEQLDKQFWLFDPDGVPRFKSEKGGVYIPPDPLEALVGLFDSDQTDLSMTVHKSIAQYHMKRYHNAE